VRSGDTLLGLALKYHITWKSLVNENHLAYPYFLEPGQVLKLPEGAWMN
jgi:LysM repeat protein